MNIKFFSILFIFIAIFAIQPSSSHGSIEIKINTASPQNFPFIPAFQEMAKFIEEKSNGKYKVSIYPNYTLGNTSTAVQGLQLGTIHFHHDGTGNMTGFSSLLGLFDLPYIFTDMDSVEHIFYGPLGAKLLQDVSTKTLTYLGFANSTFRNMITNKPVNSLDDIRKMRIRVTLSKVHAQSLREMGIPVTPMPFTEVYTGLQQGVVDGLDLDYPYTVAMNLHEVAPYVFEANHLYTPQVLVTGTRWWNSLSPEDRNVFEEGVKVWLEKSRTALNEFRDAAKKICQDAGNTIISPSAEELKRWVEAAAPTRQSLTPNQKALYDEIQKELKKAGLAM